MQKADRKNPLATFIMYILAWLGLAGITDAILEWQDWFEIGVMDHWRFLKNWAITNLLWWLPFDIPSWLIDYIVISTIITRTAPIPRWDEDWIFGPSEAIEKYGYIPFSCRMEWALSHVFQRWPSIFMVFILWPLAIPLLSIEAIRGKPFAKEVKTPANVQRRNMTIWLSGITKMAIGFIPIIFVCSTVLYNY